MSVLKQNPGVICPSVRFFSQEEHSHHAQVWEHLPELSIWLSKVRKWLDSDSTHLHDFYMLSKGALTFV